MYERDKKTSVRGMLLSIKEKANSLPSSIRNHGILGTSRIIMRIFFQYVGVMKQ